MPFDYLRREPMPEGSYPKKVYGVSSHSILQYDVIDARYVSSDDCRYYGHRYTLRVVGTTSAFEVSSLDNYYLTHEAALAARVQNMHKE